MDFGNNKNFINPNFGGNRVTSDLSKINQMKNNRSKDAAVIVLTANAISGAREMFLQEGFCDYLSKPVIPENLEKMIRKHLPEELLKNDLRQK